jgi:predicted DNA-binding transcriptional regulator AlpA
MVTKLRTGHDAGERHLTMQDLADRCGVSINTVRQWRMKGTGPRGMAIGKYVRFRLTDVLEWEESRADSHGAA